MSKAFATILAVGLAVWAVFVWRLAVRGHLLDRTAPTEEAAVPVSDLERSLAPTPDSLLTVRNPFAPPAGFYAVRPSAKPKTVAPPDTSMPPIRVDAILMGPNPVAILRLGGKTQLAKQGEKAWDAEVITIGASEVSVRYKGYVHVLRK